MEATGEDFGLLQKIIPPKLEDAGLENCALPLHSIQEAFLKAASAVGSRGGCVTDPSSHPPDQPCGTIKGGEVGGSRGEDLVVGGCDEKNDEVVVGGGDGGEKRGGECVEGIKGLGIEEREDGDDEDKEEKMPTLIEGYF